MSFTTSMQRSLAVPPGSEALSGEGRTTGSRLEAAGSLPFLPPQPCLPPVNSIESVSDPISPKHQGQGTSPPALRPSSSRATGQEHRGGTATPVGGWAPTDVPPLQGYRGWATQTEPKSHGWQAPGSSPGAYRAARPRR